MTATLVLAHNKFTLNISKMDKFIFFIHLCMLFFFIDNEEIKFGTKNYHIFQINGVCANEVGCLIICIPSTQFIQ